MVSKGRLMELTGLNGGCDSALPGSFCLAMSEHKIERAAFWYVWSYRKDDNYCKPIHLGERLIQKLEETRITVNKSTWDVSLMDLVETLLANPQDVDITIR